MADTKKNRVRKGVPTGGQFDKKKTPEATVSLDSDRKQPDRVPLDRLDPVERAGLDALAASETLEPTDYVCFGVDGTAWTVGEDGGEHCLRDIGLITLPDTASDVVDRADGVSDAEWLQNVKEVTPTNNGKVYDLHDSNMRDLTDAQAGAEASERRSSLLAQMDGANMPPIQPLDPEGRKAADRLTQPARETVAAGYVNPEMLDHLADDSSLGVRMVVAGNHATNPATLQKLAADENPGVRMRTVTPPRPEGRGFGSVAHAALLSTRPASEEARATRFTEPPALRRLGPALWPVLPVL